MQKASMRQDSVEEEHTHRRRLFGREAEHVSITRDTNESDLKQRREIRDGRVEYADQPPVRAALHGRVLVLEGIEKAERNVLPLLNNLLENREMQLEDRRFSAFVVPPLCGADMLAALVARSRPPFEVPPADAERLCAAADALQARAGRQAEECATASGAPPLAVPEGGVFSAARLLALFPALGAGTALRRVCPRLGAGASRSAPPRAPPASATCEEVHEEEELALAAAGLAPDGLEAASEARGAEYQLASVVRRGGEGGEPGGELLLAFEHGSDRVEVAAAAGRLAPAGGSAPAPPRDASARIPEQALGAEGEDGERTTVVAKLSVKELKAWLAARGVKHHDCFEKSDLVRRAEEQVPIAARGAESKARGVLAAALPGGLTLTPSQARVACALFQDHAAGMDFCVVGDKGVGKSVVVKAFAEVLGYRQHVVFCYRDMISRDLLQRRGTNAQGSTVWYDSPLVEAALTGGLAVLDGAQRLARGTLAATLGPLLCDRDAAMPDGSRLVAPSRWQRLLAARSLPADCCCFEEAGVRFRRVHPCFRCAAIAEPSGVGDAAWPDDEVACLFHFHACEPLPAEEQLHLAAHGDTDPRVFRGLFRYTEQMSKAAVDDPSLEPLRPSLRVLLRVSRHLRQRPGDVAGALDRAFSACLRFLPLSKQEAVHRLLVESMQAAGAPAAGWQLRRRAAAAADEAETRGRRERLRQLENVAIQARMFGGGTEVDRARERADRERAREAERRLEDMRRRASAVAWADAPPAPGEGSRQRAASAHPRPGEAALPEAVDGMARVGDASAPLRSPRQPELHVAVLRDMLLDWSLGHHLLLVGNQGVGKNKLTDRLLSLLRCEREYVQLHRDTTVQSLTLSPTLEAGVVTWRDAPLVRAAREGRCLVVDEADKAPVEVVCVLKALCEDGELALQAATSVPVAEGFRMIVLANRPGYPFIQGRSGELRYRCLLPSPCVGNDFYRVCGDVFSCHVVDNPDIESEVALLRSVGPDVPRGQIVQLSLLFAELRDLVEVGQLAYPYSTRELVKVVEHLQRFPEDPLEQVLASVFAFDMDDVQKRQPLLEVLRRHQIAVDGAGEALLEGYAHGDLSFKLEENRDRSKDVTNPHNADGHAPPDIHPDGPKHGEWDGQEHIGGNRFAGGSGGTGTAGLGGRWGPYRLDVGQKLVMVPEELKQGIDEQTKRKAQQMADEAYKKRLEELKMSEGEAELYAALRQNVATQIQEMKVCLEGHEAREHERQWLRNQTHGELDDSRLVDGITGSANVYTRRGEPDTGAFGASQKSPKRITFVMDISGSMYTFNRIDRRLQRLQEVATFIFESFAGLEAKYAYRMVGHSGTGPEAERLVDWGRPPRTERERLAIARRMEAHAQFCHPGDHTLEATAAAVREIGRLPADERLVFVVSDADLQRYGIDVRRWGEILQKDPSVQAYVILISNNVDEAERIKATLAPGRAHICAETASLAVTFKQIFQDGMLRGS
ncbi:unnamed protein product [Prorocentrum cordatum]|uniref:VWFA domain-containing protein n=1 Tax=Prorocentrum cordatum TaxID=2364126 RepID=A0ABN9TFP2_9DINO|nr:unnamed protein product [Polarella glacialis]